MPNEVISALKEKYPAYADIPDDDLALKIADKFPGYLSNESFSADVNRLRNKDTFRPPTAQETELAKGPEEAQRESIAAGIGRERTEKELGPSTFSGMAFEPLVEIPKFTVKPDDHPAVAVGKEAANLLIGIPESIESPGGIATFGLGAVKPALTAATFSAMALKALGESLINSYKNWGKMTTAEKFAASTDAAGMVGMAAFLGKGAAKGLKTPEPKFPVTFREYKPAEPVDMLAPKTAEALRETKTKTIGVENAIQPETETAIRNVQQPGITEEGASKVPPVEGIKETVTRGGNVPEGKKSSLLLTPEKITAAAVKTPGGVETGANHPEILQRLGREVPPADQRNTPDYGFVTDKGRFITREEAGPLAQASGQDLKQFEPGEPVHSNEVAATPGGTTPLSESKPAQTPTPAVKTAPEQPQAVPAEFEKTPQTPTGIKNATVDQERVKRGLPPAIQPARRSFGKVWDEAMARIDQNPEGQDNLLNELRDHPRALTDSEDALFLHRQIDLQNEYGKATRDLAQAFEDNRTQDVESGKLRVAGLSDKLLDLYNIGKRVGTETGRGLAARKMMANEDFSLAQMTTGKRAAVGGRELTAKETDEIQSLHDKIQATQKAYDDYRAATDEHIAKMEVDRALNEARQQAARQPIVEPHIKVLADRIKVYFDKRGDAAWKRLQGKTFTLSPEVLADLVDLGASRILSGAIEFGEWSTKMVELLGDKVKPHLQTIFEASGKALDNAAERMAGGNAEKVKQTVRGMDLNQRKDYTITKISERIKGGKKDEITTYVQKLARIFVEQGIKERDALIDSIHTALKGIDPAISRRETMDMISGYGDFKQLTKDQISVQLRDLKGQMQQVAKLEDMQAKQPPLKTGLERRVPSKEESRLIKLVNEAKRQFQIPVTDPNTQLKSSLDMLKKRLQTRTEELRRKLAEGDFSKKPKRPIKLDATASKLQAENFKAKQDYMRGLIEDRLKNRPSWIKAQDTFLRWYRGGILSSPVVFAKLTAAAVTRAFLTPAEEAVGGVISKAFPKLAERAPREGFWNSRAEAKAIVAQLTKGPKDAWDVLTKGETELDILYGKGREGAIGESQVRPFSIADIPGRSHGSLKASTKRAEFERSLEKRLAYEIRNGVDASDPAVQLRAAVEAYKDANRAIFLQDNRVVSAYNRALRALEEPSKVTGKPTPGGKLAGTIARTALPVVRVPSNIVAEAFQFATGSVTGLFRLSRAMSKGIETLPPEHADLIMRELKKGSIGAAALAVGFLLPKVWGGYYQKNVKRKRGDVKPSSARIGGENIPPAPLHHPIFEIIQAGATVRRVMDVNRKEGAMALPIGVKAASMGLVEEVPFIREMLDTAKAFNPSEQNAYFGELLKSVSEPQLIQWIAKKQDVTAAGEPITRKPKTVIQHLETGIPGLRENVPIKRASQ